MATYFSAATVFAFQGQLCCTHISLQTESPVGGEHATSTPPLPLRILSGLRKLGIRNSNKLYLKVHTATEEDCTLPSGLPCHQAKQGWKALGTNSA